MVIGLGFVLLLRAPYDVSGAARCGSKVAPVLASVRLIERLARGGAREGALEAVGSACGHRVGGRPWGGGSEAEDGSEPFPYGS